MTEMRYITDITLKGTGEGMNFYKPRTRRIIVIVCLVLVVAMVVGMVAAYML